MQRGDIVYLLVDGDNHRRIPVRFVRHVSDNPDVDEVERGVHLERWKVKRSEIKGLKREIDRLEKEAALAADMEKYQDVIDAWKQGHRTNKAIAEALGVRTACVVSRVKAAMARGFISSD